MTAMALPCNAALEDPKGLNTFGTSIFSRLECCRCCRGWIIHVWQFLFHLASFGYTVLGLVLWYTGPELPYNTGAYLTTWSYIMVLIHFFISSIISSVNLVESLRTNNSQSRRQTMIPLSSFSSPAYIPDGENVTSYQVERTPKTDGANTVTRCHFGLLYLSQIFSSVVFVFAPIVTAVYFAGICSSDVHCTSFHNINVHAVNTLFVLVDFLITIRGKRWFCVIWPVLYFMIYIIFNLVHWYINNSVIYSGFLEWKYFGRTCGYVAVVFLIVVFLHILHSHLVSFQVYCLRKYRARQSGPV
ncbi:uncharacterized protein LOC124120833 [Haliotis rufescens]|uniref:uncharacterized protein LOC124120833 n=1 Tax=Haliotis rufescens TaxID=6454 RepID=UPI00201E79B4|nr:uncharacterized protein LOC124120833 [Haliotis rufescens]